MFSPSTMGTTAFIGRYSENPSSHAESTVHTVVAQRAHDLFLLRWLFHANEGLGEGHHVSTDHEQRQYPGHRGRGEASSEERERHQCDQ